ncbi:eif3a [Symbiodinium sp. KB8]|nr:eif3a [Symbiodinium sp. KB8]
MAQYYAQVAKIFWKSDDLLFHAYATLQQFKVVAAQHGVVTAASGTGAGTAAGSDAAPPAVTALANKLICAALCVPLFADSESEDERFFHIDFDKDKKDRLAKLLNFADTPSRPELLATLGHMGVAHLASPAIGALLATLESTFQPLGIVKAAEPALVEVKADAELSEYAPALERLTLYRLLAQLTQVYSHITMEFFEELVAPLTLSGEELELEVARGCKAGLLQVRLDHCGRSIRLGQESMESDRMRSQLTALATALADVLPTLPTESGGVSDLLSAKREQVFKHAAESEDGVVTENLDRLAEIEARRREQARKAEIKKRQVRAIPPALLWPCRQAAAADAEAAALAKRQAEHEAARVAADELRRKNEKIKKLEEEMHIDAVSAALVEAGQDPKSKTHQELLELTVEQVEAEAQRKLVKSMQAAEKRREKRRLEQGFLVRAMREREQDELDAWVAAHMSVDSAYAEKQQELMRLRAEKLHEQTQLVKRRLARMMPFLGGFEDSIFQQRKEAHAAALVERRRKARADAIPGKVERARKLKQEKDQEDARLRQAELDRRAAEEHKRAEEDWRRAGPSAAVSARPPPRAEKDLDFGSLRRGPSSTPAPAPAPRDDLDFSAVRGGSAPRPSDAGPPPPVSHNIRGGRSSESSFSRWSGSSQSGERSTSSGAFGSGPKPSSGGAGGKWR